MNPPINAPLFLELEDDFNFVTCCTDHLNSYGTLDHLCNHECHDRPTTQEDDERRQGRPGSCQKMEIVSYPNDFQAKTNPPLENATSLDSDYLASVGSKGVIPAMQISPARLSYDDGYGYFCFGRWPSHPRRSVFGTVYDLKYWQNGSNDVEVPELGGSKR